MARTVVVERTGKTWKLMKAVGLLGMFGGLVLFFMAGQDVALQRAGGIAAGCGVPVRFLGRLGTWWNHA